MSKPRLVIFASGTKEGGGFGFENLVGAAMNGVLDAEIVAVVSNHERGGVRERADRLGIPFIYFSTVRYSNILQNVRMSDTEMAEAYCKVVAEAMGRGAMPPSEPRSTAGTEEWVALSGWMKQVRGLDPRQTFNIHPALLSFDHGRFGGKGMYGRHIHEAVKAAFDAGEITESGFTMHFVTDEFDRGPAFFEYRISLRKGISVEQIAKTVNLAEHEWQPRITNMVVHEDIRWDGKNPESLVVPKEYKYLPKY